MRIRSLTVRRYRVHGDLRIELDAARTVIGGPNEVGKSTLAEAMQRALFLRARGNTELHRAMKSSRHHGTPEVEIEIECGGETVAVRKVFGSAGSTRLERPGRPALHGDDAEEALAEMLGVSVGGAPRVIEGHWAHVFVRQGTALADPLEHAAAPHDALIARLQSLGGAAVVQSELDVRVARRFAEQRDAILTQGAQPRAGSDLASATKALERALANRDEAERRIQALEAHAETLDRSSRDLRDAEAQKETYAKAQAELEARQARLKTLEEDQSRLQVQIDRALERHRALAKVDADIRRRDAAIVEARADLEPRQRRLAEAQAQAATAADAAKRAEAALAEAHEAQRRAERRRGRLAAKARAVRADDELRTLETQRTQVKSLNESLLKFRSDRARLADVDEAAVKRLQDLAKKVERARTTLEAMATNIAVVEGDGTVEIGGEKVGAGESRTVVDRTEIRVGRGVLLSIAPGGGTSLEDARRNADKAQRTLDDALAGLGVASVDAATSAHHQRSRFEERIESLEAQLEDLSAETVEERLADAKLELAAAHGEVERLAAPGEDSADDADVDRIDELLQRAAHEAETALDLVDARQVESKKATEARRRAEVQVEELRSTIGEDERTLHGEVSQRDLLVEQHGTEDARRTAIAELDAEVERQRRGVADVAAEIATLQPERLAADAGRIARVLRSAGESIQASRIAIGTAENALRSDGGEDPREQFAQADAALAAARQRHDAARRHAEAIRLLDELFRGEQAQLTERLTKPLESRIGGYLECIFGSGTGACLVHGDGGFSGLRLSREASGAETYPFEALSGGTREQVAAAVRLAMAEVLADDFDGCLPVILDDAFAYSDPDRVARLQRMLDLAAVRGLQVVVLTCNPADYVGLGAKAITIRPETRRAASSVVRAGAEDDAEDAADDGALARSPLPCRPDTVAPQHAEFLAALQAAGGRSGNMALRERLGWDEATYERFKQELVDAGHIVRAPGRGGSVRLLDGLDD